MPSVLSVPREWHIEQIQQHITSIAHEKFDYGLKEWQELGAAKLLKGHDVMLLVATGEGKSTVFQLYALARPKDIIIVVSPLKMLEENMVGGLCARNFKAIALNADTISAARREGKELWKECKDGHHQIIFVSPEFLASEEMNKLLGKRQAQRTVEKSLGLGGDCYYFLKRDCCRKNLFIRLRRINHSISGTKFKDLDWLLTEGDIRSAEDLKHIPKTIVYTNTVMQGYHATRYLQSRLPWIPKSESMMAIRHLHAATCVDCKNEILLDFTRPGSEGKLRIILATDAFGCGIDIPDIHRVINLGTPTSADNGNQRIGRAGRGIESADAYIYVGSRLWDATKKHVETGSIIDDKIKACKHFQKLLVTHHQGKCINQQIRIMYGDTIDPEENRSCELCSGCIPETAPEDVGNTPAKRKRARKPAPLVRKARKRGPGRLTTEITKKTRDELAFLVMGLWLAVPVDESSQFDGVDSFLSDEKFEVIHKHLRDLDTTDIIQQVLVGWNCWNAYGNQLALGILNIRARMIQELEANKEARGHQLTQPEQLLLDMDGDLEAESDPELDYESESDTSPAEGSHCK
ncbi:Bloom syndrome protein homolog OS=Drosophila melanogaster GN=mus309 PE=1 SV=1 [Rhizoctonia solani AG-1 IB]|uniref:DNA 3'-5' helicase n=1 Tax=Thanatephorus cucumeris (strain AG1-IB / isolate 7/3/14) TaxID=1108050 RepID=A0A0B7FR64_THACB|nr:Bloom syndrome protein homolog OS=Drosophila melanogaster GN=mus309 PE=1 SV=1 [Rhizoctonia solani AG-1 IB]